MKTFNPTLPFDKAIISLNNKKIAEGKITHINYVGDGDRMIIEINNKTYLSHVSNVVLIKE